MKDNFERAFEYLIHNEAGYVNNKNDSGGPTKYGITQKTLGRWRGFAVSASEVQALTRDEAKLIYAAWYWRPLGLEGVNSLVIATIIFDAGVLFGVSITAIISQRSLQEMGFLIRDDGLIGPLTIQALNSGESEAFVKEFQRLLGHRIDEIVSAQPKDLEFKDGWKNRVKRYETLIA